MRTIYAVQLDVGGPHSEAQTPFDTAVALSLEWCGSHYCRRGIQMEPLPVEGHATPAPGHAIQRSTTRCSDGSALWQLNWSYPSDDDARTLWRSDVTVSSVGDRTQVAVVLRLASAEHVVAPFRFTLGRPRLVRSLAEGLACPVGPQRVRATAGELAAEDMAWFVDRVIRDPARRLPVVLVTPTGFSEPPLVPPDELADSLIGLADVWYALDREATWELTEIVGRDLSCFNGAVRTYWPDFERLHDPFAHPLLLPSRLSEIGDVRQWMLRSLAGVSALRFVEGDVIRAAQECARGDATRQMEALRARADAGAASMDEYDELLQMASDENVSLRARVGELEALQAALQSERDALYEELEVLGQASKANALALAQMGPTASSVADLERETQPAAPTTVLEALDRAEAECGDVFVVHPRAKDGAEESDYRSPDRAYEVLLKIADVYRRKFSAPLGQSLVDAFSAVSLDYKPDAGVVTKGQYRRQYECRHQGRTCSIVQHVTLRGRPNQGTFCVHWAELSGESKILIGHVGKHLDYATGS